jgi:HD-GYP domain-containing protein (c-di-GMP phosphodiesterase class II)
MPNQELKIDVEGLDFGMRVVRLDCPWLDTPMSTQDLKISNFEEIKILQSHCKHVFIDISTGTRPDPQFVIIEKKTVKKSTPEIEMLHKTDYEIDLSFSEESLPQAEKIKDKLEGAVKDIMTDLKEDKKLDLSLVHDGVKAMIDGIIHNPAGFQWVNQLKETDDYTYHHSLGCAIWSATFGRFLGLERYDLERVALGGLLLDIGKSKIPQQLLSKAATLSDQEKKICYSHLSFSIKQLSSSGLIDHDIMRMIATHHERHDGSGYPLGLKGDKIPIFGRIAGIIDSYDAMVSKRPFQQAKSPHDAISELYDLRDTKHQGALVEQFIQSCGVYPSGSLVELSTGEIAVVTELNSMKRLRPVVMVLLNANKSPKKEFTMVDLSWGTNDDVDVVRGIPAGSFGIDMDSLFL